jgi:formate dehydrogenase beta subunit
VVFWFGRHGRKGLRSFSVSGRVKKPGVKLAPAGITMAEFIEEYCGGMQDGHEFYAYLPGGASGGILPASLSDIPSTLTPCKPMAASLVRRQSLCWGIKTRRAMLRFEHDELLCARKLWAVHALSSGHRKAVQLMQAAVWDNATLEDLNQVMTDASICGLGQAAPNPVRCVQKYFPQEVI